MKKDLKRFFKAIAFTLILTSLFSFISEQPITPPQQMSFVGSIAEPFLKEGVFIGAKAYTPRESMNYLNRNLLDKGFQPVQLTIQNNTAKSYYLSKDGVKTPNATTDQVTFSVSRSAIPRSIAFKVVGFLFWPFLIPGAVDSIVTFHTHAKMTKDYRAKSIKEEKESIPPYSTVNRVLFIPKRAYSEEFSLFLEEGQNGRLHPFQVVIQAPC